MSLISGVSGKVADYAVKGAARVGYKIPSPGISQVMHGTGSAASMIMGENNGILDTALNIAGIASIFYAPLMLPVAMLYAAKALTYVPGIIKSALSFDLGGLASNAGAAGLNLLGALPVFGKGLPLLQRAFSVSKEAAGGKILSGIFAENFAEKLVKLFAHSNNNQLINKGYQAAVGIFKETPAEVGLLTRILKAVKEYFTVAGSNITKIGAVAEAATTATSSPVSRQLLFDFMA